MSSTSNLPEVHETPAYRARLHALPSHRWFRRLLAVALTGWVIGVVAIIVQDSWSPARVIAVIAAVITPVSGLLAIYFIRRAYSEVSE